MIAVADVRADQRLAARDQRRGEPGQHLGQGLARQVEQRPPAEHAPQRRRGELQLGGRTDLEPQVGAALAGVLVAPVTLTGAQMGAALGLKAFAVAIIGGLNSGLGVVVGGLILGITENLTGYYISTGYKDVPGLVLLLLVLSFKPSGLFGKKTIKKV